MRAPAEIKSRPIFQISLEALPLEQSSRAQKLTSVHIVFPLKSKSLVFCLCFGYKMRPKNDPGPFFFNKPTSGSIKYKNWPKSRDYLDRGQTPHFTWAESNANET